MSTHCNSCGKEWGEHPGIMSTCAHASNQRNAGDALAERLRAIPQCGCGMWCCIDCQRDQLNVLTLKNWEAARAI